jgi:hypothetical protein
MNDLFKWIGKFFIHLVIWIFILSIRWDGKTLFSYAHNVLVQNALVQAIDEELADVWYRLSETARVTFSDSEKEDGTKM